MSTNCHSRKAHGNDDRTMGRGQRSSYEPELQEKQPTDTLYRPDSSFWHNGEGEGRVRAHAPLFLHFLLRLALKQPRVQPVLRALPHLQQGSALREVVEGQRTAALDRVLR